MSVKAVILAIVAVISLTEAHGPVLAHHGPEPYKFGYSVKDHHGEQHREEVGDGHSGVKGSYGFTDERGVHRQVHYVADHAGFRAEVKTNEHGTAESHPAAVHVSSSAHPYFGGAGKGHGYGGHGYGGYGGHGYGGHGHGYGGYGHGYGGYGHGYGGYGHGYGGYGHGGYGHGYGGYGLGHGAYGHGHGGHGGYGGPY